MPALVTRVHTIMLAEWNQMLNAGSMSRMSRFLVVVAVLGAGGLAQAEPSTRLGLTLGIADQGAPGVFQIGPQASLGERLGPIVGELDYAYLSFFDPSASPTGVHRIGVTLRADVLRSGDAFCSHFACTRGRSIYAEIGGAERFGKWQVDAYHQVPANDPVPEAHIGIGLELDNQVVPYRYGWQLGLRFAVSPRDQESIMASCRGNCSTVGGGSSSGGGLDRALLVEWMFLFGR